MSVDKDEIRQRKPEEDEDYEPGSDDDEIDSVTQPVASAGNQMIFMYMYRKREEKDICINKSYFWLLYTLCI